MKNLGKIFVAILIIAVLMCIYVLDKKNQELDALRNGNTQTEQEQIAQKARLEAYEQLAKADDYFISGNFDSAMAIYPLIADYFEDKRILPLREQSMDQQLAMLEQFESKDKESYNRMLEIRERMSSEVTATRSQYEAKMDSLIAVLNAELGMLLMEKEEAEQKLRQRPRNKSLTFYSKSGTRTTYFGEVVNNKANGQGAGYYSTGNAYVGPWKDNLRHGDGGKFMWIGGESYEGQYENDKRSGEGTYHWANGDHYTGKWANDKQNGVGTLYNSDGQVKLRGEWRDGELVKEL